MQALGFFRNNSANRLCRKQSVETSLVMHYFSAMRARELTYFTAGPAAVSTHKQISPAELPLRCSCVSGVWSSTHPWAVERHDAGGFPRLLHPTRTDNQNQRTGNMVSQESEVRVSRWTKKEISRRLSRKSCELLEWFKLFAGRIG